jgi:hypothetical protein
VHVPSQESQRSYICVWVINYCFNYDFSLNFGIGIFLFFLTLEIEINFAFQNIVRVKKNVLSVSRFAECSLSFLNSNVDDIRINPLILWLVVTLLSLGIHYIMHIFVCSLSKCIVCNHCKIL